jgi:hypothetical protein
LADVLAHVEQQEVLLADTDVEVLRDLLGGQRAVVNRDEANRSRPTVGVVDFTR